MNESLLDGAQRPPGAELHALRAENEDLQARLLVQAAQLEVATRMLRQETIEHERAEDRYRQLFERSPLPMWVYDVDTLRFLAVNRAAVAAYGWSREEFLRMTILDIRPVEEVPRLRQALERRVRGEELRRAWRHRTRAGEQIDVEVYAHDLRFGTSRARFVIARDVTERRRVRAALAASRARLRHAQKMEAIGRLAGGVAHDVGNVVTVIASAADLLAEHLAGDAEALEDVEAIRDAAARAAELTGRLLAIGRRQHRDPARIAVNRVVTDALELLRRLVGPQVVLRTDLHDDAGDIRADVTQLVQVLLNLAANARDAMPAGGTLLIRTRSAGDPVPKAGAPPAEGALLEVVDSGGGIPEHARPHLFEPFFTTKGDRGTGLGLSTVYGIVTQNGGHVSFESTPAVGTTFSVWLPRAR